MELNDIRWRKSSRSGDNGGACVELGAVWRKSSRSADNGGHCVELAAPAGFVAVRDSKDPEGGALVFSRTAFRRFAEGLKSQVP